MPSSSRDTGSSRPFLAAFASAMLPGIGHFIAGDSRRGWRLLAIDVLLLATLLFFLRDALSNKFALVALWLDPATLVAMMVANILLLGYRVWAASDAYQIAKKRNPLSKPRPPGSVLVGAVVLGAVLFVPHAVFGYYDLIQYDLLTTVFQEETAARAAESFTPLAPLATTDTTHKTVTSPLPDATTIPPQPTILTENERLNILLIGSDAGVGRRGIRTDTMITVSLDPATGEAAMFSIPRNWTHAPLPEGMGIWDCNCYPELINELWEMGERYPDHFPGPGTPSENAVKGVVSEFLGIPIHYYAMVDLAGFVQIVDALGGIEMYVPTKILDEEYPHEDGTVMRLEIPQGWQRMDGHIALAYARTRDQDSDYSRMNRQRCVIEAMVEQADPVSLILNFRSLADVIKRTMMTDIPIDALPQLIELLPSLDIANIVSLRFIPPEYHLKYREDGKLGRIANIDLIHEHVQLVITDPQRAIIELGIEQLEDVCGDPTA